MDLELQNCNRDRIASGQRRLARRRGAGLGRRAEMATVRESIHQKLQETGEKDRCVPTHRRSRPGAVRSVASRAV